MQVALAARPILPSLWAGRQQHRRTTDGPQCAMLLMMWGSAILQRCVPLLPRSCCSGVRYEWFHAVRSHTVGRTACLKRCWGWGRLCAAAFAGGRYSLYFVRVLLVGFLATISQGELHQPPVIIRAAMSCNARIAAKGKEMRRLHRCCKFNS